MDPIEGGALNAYDYAAQDPINAYDLSGTCVGWGWWCRGVDKIKKKGGRIARKAAVVAAGVVVISVGVHTIRLGVTVFVGCTAATRGLYVLACQAAGAKIVAGGVIITGTGIELIRRGANG